MGLARAVLLCLEFEVALVLSPVQFGLSFCFGVDANHTPVLLHRIQPVTTVSYVQIISRHQFVVFLYPLFLGFSDEHSLHQ